MEWALSPTVACPVSISLQLIWHGIFRGIHDPNYTMPYNLGIFGVFLPQKFRALFNLCLLWYWFTLSPVATLPYRGWNLPTLTNPPIYCEQGRLYFLHLVVPWILLSYRGLYPVPIPYKQGSVLSKLPTLWHRESPYWTVSRHYSYSLCTWSEFIIIFYTMWHQQPTLFTVTPWIPLLAEGGPYPFSCAQGVSYTKFLTPVTPWIPLDGLLLPVVFLLVQKSP